MSNYIKATNFRIKDTLVTGDPNKRIKGSEIDDEFVAIATAVSSKANSASPALTGTPTAPTAAAGNNSTQVATTAFVGAQINANASNVNITGGTISGASISNVTGDIAVADGGTGKSVLAINSVLLGNGTSPVQEVAPSSTGNVLTSDGSTWKSLPAGGIGVGQTWQDVTSSRSSGATYTNATGTPIMVSITSTRLNSSSSVVVTVGGVIIFAADTTGVWYASHNPSFIVPNNTTYSVKFNNCSIRNWAELR